MNHGHGTPSELDLLAYVEGELHGAPAAAVELALRADPALAREVEGMRNDRAALRAMANERAPHGLVDAALASAERAALLSEPSSEFDRLPKAPARIVVRPSRVPAVRRFALAAGVVLTAGGAVWVTTLAMRGGTTPIRTDAPIANRSAVGEQSPFTTSDGREPTTADGSQASTLSVAVGPDTARDAARSGDTGSSPAMKSSTDFAEADAPAMTTERAAGLASEGRLAMRIVPRERVDQTRLASGLGRLTRGSDSRGWRLNADISPDLAVSVLAQLDASPQAAAIAERCETQRELRTALASANDRAGERADAPPDRSVELDRFGTARPRQMFTLESPNSPAALEAARSALAGVGNVEVVFEELPAPVRAGPALAESNVLWWRRPVATWTARAVVPVVVESER